MRLNQGSKTSLYVDFEFDFDPATWDPAVVVDGTPFPATWQGAAVAVERFEGRVRVTTWTRTAMSSDRFAAGTVGAATSLAAGDHKVQGQVTKGDDVLRTDPQTLEVA